MSDVSVLRSIDSIRHLVRRAWAARHDVAVVPTMGALHEGHLSLIDAAAERCGFVVVTIFVNPTQFAPDEDLDRYPRPFEDDVRLAGERGASVIFAPERDEMYTPEASTWVTVEGLSAVWEGKHRPDHFRGVTTVVAKLLNILQPDIAVFGQKDFQQLLLVEQMVRDLNMPVEIVPCPIVREADGLAMSSRNRYLSPDERRVARRLSESLALAAREWIAGTTNPSAIRSLMRDHLLDETDRAGVPVEVDYATVVDRETLAELDGPADSAIVLVAATVGATRLIDNQFLPAFGSGSESSG